MRLCLLCSALLLSACTGSDRVTVAPLPHNVPADLLMPCAGYIGPVPTSGTDDGHWHPSLQDARIGARFLAVDAGAIVITGKLAATSV